MRLFDAHLRIRTFPWRILLAGCATTWLLGCSEAGPGSTHAEQGGGGSGGASAGTSGSSGAGGGATLGGSSGGGSPSGGAGMSGVSGGAGSSGQGGAVPLTLSSTGLFSSIDDSGALVLGPGVLAYEPRYKLWSDSANKARWVCLPAGSKIDTSDPDHWSVPVGTKFWKEFAIGSQRVETRLIERTGPGAADFSYTTYHWETAADAKLVPPDESVLDASGTSHDIPSQQQCKRCHAALAEHILGFGALQLSHDLPGVTAKSLRDQALLTTPLPEGIAFPGDQVAQDALGYLHANCGGCHNDSPGIPLDGLPAPQMYLRVLVGDKTPEATGAYRTALNQKVTKTDIDLLRIQGGDPASSAIHYRMNVRGSEDQMPPIATENVDMTGLTMVAAWIKKLPAP